ncbi:MAG: hypothetical protein A3F84_12985 [Candidatus Handelsmanbacteria bacterium RIFCSPLOWO2_12_FULL_64_10]|uniref:Glycosyltransferase RgtA/B/C/D-like domain-containing protein n=1 Tax=Handelsmanbacteria sp. (strain RIFCSPLOWO2_12_FULL_64_10) TaxID=1817868 RepID=A0A1F6D0Z2_HANXR|nr:MAG: hypothetical protein A3F84_12985 [Candidatus Handelsmanbacteria bacterium RIFCSPLOWO2_12_FULL_64_10]
MRGAPTARGSAPLLLILALGVWLRFTGLDWGIASLKGYSVDGRRLSVQDASFHPDADALTRASASLRESIHPHIVHEGKTYLYSVYGPVFMYLWWIAGKAVAPFAGFSPFNLQDVRDADLTRLVGRGLSALAGSATVYLIYRIGTRCYGRRAGLLAALFLAATVLHIQSSHFATVDVLMGFFVALSFVFFLDVADPERRAGAEVRPCILSGVAVGLAAATKLNAAVALLPLMVACLQGATRGKAEGGRRKADPSPSIPLPRRERGKEKLVPPSPLGKGVRGLGLFFAHHLFLALGAFVATFALLVPSSVLRFRDYFFPPYFGSVTHSALLNVGEAMMRGSYHFIGTPAYLYQVFNLFPAGMGVPLEVAALLGCAWAACRRRREDILLLSFAIPYFLIVGQFQTKYIRYFVVWMPFACLLAARLLTDLSNHARRAVRVPAVVVAGIVGLYTTACALTFTSIYRAPDVRVEAARYLSERATPGVVIVCERGHNNLRNLLPEQGRAYRTLDIDALYRFSKSADLIGNRFYLSAACATYLKGADWLVLSDDRLASRGRYPFATQYYDALFSGDLGFTLDRAFVCVPQALGVSFGDTASDVTCRQFDHPRIFVFRRAGEARAPRPDYRALLRLDTWEKVHRTLDLAAHANDALVFRECLSQEVRAATSDLEVYSAMETLSARPDLLSGMRDERYFVREEDGWGLNLKMTFTD